MFKAKKQTITREYPKYVEEAGGRLSVVREQSLKVVNIPTALNGFCISITSVKLKSKYQSVQIKIQQYVYKKYKGSWFIFTIIHYGSLIYC